MEPTLNFYYYTVTSKQTNTRMVAFFNKPTYYSYVMAIMYRVTSIHTQTPTLVRRIVNLS